MLEVINRYILGAAVPMLLIIGGIFFCFKLRFFFLKYPKKLMSALCGRQSGRGTSSFRALTLALAGTLGVGNIVGVSAAIFMGGFGAVFWMWISALCAMVLKYAEIVLAMLHRRRDGESGEFFGGAPYYIKDLFTSRRKSVIGKTLAAVFAILCILNSITMGCMIQSNAASTSVSGVFGVSGWIVGGAVALLCCFVIVVNASWVSGFCEKTVPLMTLGYILISVAVIAMRWEGIPRAFAVIFEDAFSFESSAGGVFGFFLSSKLRAGTMRGLMSNEAGCGTAPTAHASSNTESPAKQGLWGIFEVFVDTILLCTLTALVIILAGDGIFAYSDNPMMMAIKAYSSVLGGFADWFFCAAVFCFGYATLLCWGSYGMESVRFLSPKKRWRILYILVFGLCILFGVRSAPEAVWNIGDFGIATMTFINLCVLLLLRKEIKAETLNFVKKEKREDASFI